MRVVILPHADAVAEHAAARIAALIERRPAAVLALPTGRTPVGTYAALVARHRQRGLDFSRASAFLIDEYFGLGSDDARSFRAYLHEHLAAHVNLDPERVHGLDGLTRRPDEECARYEARIRGAGGLDLAVLGIGGDGHIGFNEPGSSLASRTRVKTLTSETWRASGSGADAPDLPRVALTMGVGTLLDARAVLLLATGEAKARAVARAVEGPVTAQVTASALQLHPAAEVVLDEGAAAELERADYYRESEAAQRALEDRLAER